MTGDQMFEAFRNIKDQIHDKALQEIIDNAFWLGFYRSNASEIEHEFSKIETEKAFGRKIDREHIKSLNSQKRINEQEFESHKSRITTILKYSETIESDLKQPA